MCLALHQKICVHLLIESHNNPLNGSYYPYFIDEDAEDQRE